MGNLKINVAIGAFKVEIEGDSTEVINQFNQMRKEGFGRIGDMASTVEVKNVPFETGKVVTAIEDNNQGSIKIEKEADIGHSLYDVVSKGLPSGENEWVLVYGYYITTGGQSNFTRKDIINKYDESKRKSKTRIKNLSASINSVIKSGWMSQLNDNDYLLTQNGKSKAMEIISREKGITKLPKKKTKAGKKQSDNS